jgi:hypothetical protein
MTEEFCLLRYNAVQCGGSQPGIQVNISSPSSLLKNKPSRKLCLLHADFLFTLLFNPEDRGDIFVRNVDLFADYMALYSRR